MNRWGSGCALVGYQKAISYWRDELAGSQFNELAVLEEASKLK
jgi:hypothetical protein